MKDKTATSFRLKILFAQNDIATLVQTLHVVLPIIPLRHQPKSLRSCTRDSTTHAQVSCIIHGGKQVTLFLEEHFPA